jgi:hypothetical protein
VLAGAAGAGALDAGAAVVAGAAVAGALDVRAAVVAGAAVLGGAAFAVVATGLAAVCPATSVDADVAGLPCASAVGFDPPLAAPTMMMIRMTAAPRNDKNLCLRMNPMACPFSFRPPLRPPTAVTMASTGPARMLLVPFGTSARLSQISIRFHKGRCNPEKGKLSGSAYPDAME